MYPPGWPAVARPSLKEKQKTMTNKQRHMRNKEKPRNKKTMTNKQKSVSQKSPNSSSKNLPKIFQTSSNICRKSPKNIKQIPLQGSFKNKEACPRSASEKPWKNLFLGGYPYIQGVKYIQFLTRNPIFRSKMSKSGTGGQKYGKT